MGTQSGEGSGPGGVGGSGVGGNGNGGAGVRGTGGGGGGSLHMAYTSGGSGGSGLVVIQYSAPAAQFTGGVITVNNGVITHVFTSTGALTSLT